MTRPATLPIEAYAPLREALPGARPEAARWIGSGWGAAAFLVPSADGDWVARVPSAVPWSVEDLEREVRTVPLLESRPFEVTVPRDARLVRDAEGALLAAVHRMVPGSTSKGRALRGRARREHLAGIGRFLAVLHTTPHEATRAHGVEARDTWRELSLPRIEETMALAGPMSRAWLEDRVRTFEALEPSSATVALIHGDLSGDHLLMHEDGRLSGVIDWTEARLSDPALDFAGVLNRFSWRDLEVVRAHYDAPVDATLMERARVYIDIVPIYSVTDGYIAAGEAERAAGLRKLAARAAAWARATGRGNRTR
ncbi:MAG: aminoglycoside phosphotransferase family protein [Dehalococcoidia bacterium]|nr:aminoglycoside phosphotransferase family protein [Dehalococcoidia bacterium]